MGGTAEQCVVHRLGHPFLCLRYFSCPPALAFSTCDPPAYGYSPLLTHDKCHFLLGDLADHQHEKETLPSPGLHHTLSWGSALSSRPALIWCCWFVCPTLCRGDRGWRRTGAQDRHRVRSGDLFTGDSSSTPSSYNRAKASSALGALFWRVWISFHLPGHCLSPAPAQNVLNKWPRLYAFITSEQH